MNADQVKGAAKDAIGKMQRKAGKMIGSKEQQAKGAAKQVEGKIQKGIGNIKASMKGAEKK